MCVQEHLIVCHSRILKVKFMHFPPTPPWPPAVYVVYLRSDMSVGLLITTIRSPISKLLMIFSYYIHLGNGNSKMFDLPEKIKPWTVRS